MNNYVKLITQIVIACASALVAAMQNGPITGVVWINVLLSGIGCVMVVGAGELPSGIWSHTKTYLSALSAGLVVLSSATHGWDRATVLQAVVAVFGVLAVASVPGPVTQAIGQKPGLLAIRRTHGKHEGA